MKFRLDKWHHFFHSRCLCLWTVFYWMGPLLCTFFSVIIFFLKFSVIYTECPFIIHIQSSICMKNAWAIWKKIRIPSTPSMVMRMCVDTSTQVKRFHCFMNETNDEQTDGQNEQMKQTIRNSVVQIYKIIHIILPHLVRFILANRMKQDVGIRAHIFNATSAPFLLFIRA